MCAKGPRKTIYSPEGRISRPFQLLHSKNIKIIWYNVFKHISQNHCRPYMQKQYKSTNNNFGPSFIIPFSTFEFLLEKRGKMVFLFSSFLSKYRTAILYQTIFFFRYKKNYGCCGAL